MSDGTLLLWHCALPKNNRCTCNFTATGLAETFPHLSGRSGDSIWVFLQLQLRGCMEPGRWEWRHIVTPVAELVVKPAFHSSPGAAAGRSGVGGLSPPGMMATYFLPILFSAGWSLRSSGKLSIEHSSLEAAVTYAEGWSSPLNSSRMQKEA